MLFNSLSFLFFFPLTTIVYFALPHRFRWAHLLLCSALFYVSFVPSYLLILVGVIAIDYLAGLGIERTRGPLRRLLLAMSLVANVGILAAFKYFNFFNDNLHALSEALHWNYPIRGLGWLLPVGLSFHTFQSMSYTIEVYLGRQRAERHLGIYAVYVLFYPQLVAGPIERPQNLLHQFRERKTFDPDRVFSGLRLMLWGFFKKIVVADRLAPMVDEVYKNPHAYGGGWLLAATYFFAIQIYCDFSGYSDVAIGAARVLGFTLMTNFDRPYASASVAEFWRRWHISLSTWFRDYLYIPLGGSRVGRMRWALNVMVVFLVSGFWHGANWTYLAWGGLHGLFLIGSRALSAVRERFFLPPPVRRDGAIPVGSALADGMVPIGVAIASAEADPTRTMRTTSRTTVLDRTNPLSGPSPEYRAREGLRRAVGVFITFNLVVLAWVFFRAASVSQALWILGHLGRGPWWGHPDASAFPLGILPFRASQLRLALTLILAMEAIQWAASLRGATERWLRLPEWVRWPAYYTLIVCILLLGDLGARTFIYFQF